MTAPRIAPALPPFPDDIQERLDRLMPDGVPPLTLFTTLARNPRVLRRVFAGGLLDRGTLSLRQREIVIDRTCARCGCAYEWGVHVAFFAERAGLTPGQIESLGRGGADDACWSGEERLLIRLCDALHDEARLPDPLWGELATAFAPEQLIELTALAGFYHLISFAANALRLAPESYAAPLPAP